MVSCEIRKDVGMVRGVVREGEVGGGVVVEERYRALSREPSLIIILIT